MLRSARGNDQQTAPGWGGERGHLCALHSIRPLAGSTTSLGSYGLGFKDESNINIL